MPEPLEPMNMIVQPPSGRPRRSPLWAATIGVGAAATVFLPAFVDWTWWWSAAIALVVIGAVELGDRFLPKTFTTRN
ncbi:hypothetical protein [Rhodococcus sp. NPDC049939]|uniref:hypothetical protein n=1 Tax=Rhodococcus sp. NPDC049939 TaxID=3155511 RepID=UPI0033E8CF3D